MWWFNRRALLMLPLALAACGFQPVYGPGGAGSTLYGKVEVSAPDDVESYWLVQNLEQTLGRSAAAGTDYKLDVKVTTTSQGQAITASNETTRYAIVGTATYKLSDKDSGAVLASGEVESFTGYSATGSTVDTLAGERDARQRLMTILSDMLTTKLYSTLDLPA
ncbi:LPS assembly lipoprotein LptE [Ruegeria sp. WL0004]|uniref:LPS assembly lipoprotein LptE n=1 Tax=Ruegeria marisflavi TaxID=2984152 RepID=A0ABT2WJY8_9RHOB|nr:LPS assembly lipoprotein LptE [Ruegeria sp. WL0004]MCU9836210.1 LPS assembly lipoprotein LptE [Ruegeria sp. WL0004]